MARVRVDCRHVPAAWETPHTVNSSLELTYVEFTFHNRDDAARTVQVCFIPEGTTTSSDADREPYEKVGLKAGNALQPGETRMYTFHPFLQPGDRIEWKADTAGKVVADAAILEE